MDQEKEKKSEGDNSLMHDFSEKSSSPGIPMKIIVFSLVIVLLGIGSGYLLANSGAKSGFGPIDKLADSSNVEQGKTYGDGDPAIFKDVAEGELKKGGIEGEGQFHLERPGGVSKNVYLTSSIIDLSEFEGRKIKVWGQTFAGEKAGWLMDVGKVEVLD